MKDIVSQEAYHVLRDSFIKEVDHNPNGKLHTCLGTENRVTPFTVMQTIQHSNVGCITKEFEVLLKEADGFNEALLLIYNLGRLSGMQEIGRMAERHFGEDLFRKAMVMESVRQMFEGIIGHGTHEDEY